MSLAAGRVPPADGVSRSLRVWLLTLLLLGSSKALTEEPPAFLARLQEHPSLLAAGALLASAELQLQSVFDPVSLSASGGYARLVYEEGDPLPPGVDVPEDSWQFTLAATFRPLPFGDIADLATQRGVERDRAALAYREALTQLETRALETQADLLLARQGLALAQAGLELAERGRETTRLRFDQEAATAGELLEAERSLLEAQANVRRAEADVELAGASLALLVGDARLETLPDLPVVQGTLPAVTRAQWDLVLAEVATGAAQRTLIPVAQAGVDWTPDEKNTVSLSLESRTLQPRLSYRYQDPASGSGLPGTQTGPALRARVSIGISLEVSPAAIRALEVVQQQLAAALQGLEATRDQAAVTELTLQRSREAAQRQLELARRGTEIARRTRDDIATRLELGLVTELELQRAELDLMQAELRLRSAEIDRLRRTLDSYRTYAIPVSEVLK